MRPPDFRNEIRHLKPFLPDLLVDAQRSVLGQSDARVWKPPLVLIIQSDEFTDLLYVQKSRLGFVLPQK